MLDAVRTRPCVGGEWVRQYGCVQLRGGGRKLGGGGWRANIVVPLSLIVDHCIVGTGVVVVCCFAVFQLVSFGVYLIHFEIACSLAHVRTCACVCVRVCVCTSVHDTALLSKALGGLELVVLAFFCFIATRYCFRRRSHLPEELRLRGREGKWTGEREREREGEGEKILLRCLHSLLCSSPLRVVREALQHNMRVLCVPRVHVAHRLSSSNGREWSERVRG